MTMYKGLIIAGIAGALGLISGNVSAQGLVSSPAAALQEYCNYDSARRTIIYIDQNLVSKSDTEWWRPIVSNTSYMPYERITYKMINAKTGDVKDLWETCYPRHSAEKFAELEEQETIFSKSVEDKQEDAQDYFLQAQNNALGKVVMDTPHDAKPQFDGNFPHKSLIEAMYYDKGAYRLEGKTTRVIVFSDMVENSDLIAPQKLSNGEPAELAAQVAKKMSGNFRNAEFNVYGVGYTHSNSSLNRKLETFWSHWLNYSGARLASFSPQLMLDPESSDVHFTSYTGVLETLDDMKIATRLRLGVTPSSNLYNSWLAIRNVRYPIEGEMVCDKDRKDCTVNATIDFAGHDAKLFKEGDVMKLEGSQDNLSGKIGAPDDLIVGPDGQVFRMNIVFEADANLAF